MDDRTEQECIVDDRIEQECISCLTFSAAAGLTKRAHLTHAHWNIAVDLGRFLVSE
jgi:hypothetical protein